MSILRKPISAILSTGDGRGWRVRSSAHTDKSDDGIHLHNTDLCLAEQNSLTAMTPDLNESGRQKATDCCRRLLTVERMEVIGHGASYQVLVTANRPAVSTAQVPL